MLFWAGVWIPLSPSLPVQEGVGLSWVACQMCLSRMDVLGILGWVKQPVRGWAG